MSVKIIHVQKVLNVKIRSVAIPVKMLTNVPQGLITVAVKPAVKIQAGLLFANVNRDIKATEKVDEDVKTLTSAKRMFARLVLVVSIQRVVTDALISMNVLMEPINVIQMLSVKMPRMDTCVLAIMVIQEMELLVMM